jgi:hypothetical protein
MTSIIIFILAVCQIYGRYRYHNTTDYDDAVWRACLALPEREGDPTGA